MFEWLDYMDDFVAQLTKISKNGDVGNSISVATVHGILDAFIQLQVESQKWPNVIKETIILDIKEKERYADVPDVVNEVLQEFAKYMQDTLGDEMATLHNVAKTDIKRLFLSTLNNQNEIRSQDGDTKNKSELFSFIQQFDTEVPEFIGLDKKRMYALSKTAIKGTIHEKTMNKATNLNIFQQTYLTILLSLQQTQYQKYLNKKKKGVITDPTMLDDLLLKLNKLEGVSINIDDKPVKLLPMEMKSSATTQAMFEDTYHISVVKLASSILSDFKIKLVDLVKELLKEDSLQAILILEKLQENIVAVFDFAELSKIDVHFQISQLVQQNFLGVDAEEMQKAVCFENEIFSKYEMFMLKTKDDSDYNFGSDDLREIMFGIYDGTRGGTANKI